MRLYTFEHAGTVHLGAEVKGQLVELRFGSKFLIEQNGPFEGSAKTLPTNLLAIIRDGGRSWRLAVEAAALGMKRMALPIGERLIYSFEEVQLLPPLLRPSKILCAEKNFRGHAGDDDASMTVREPLFFMKAPSALAGPGESIIKPPAVAQLDFEVALAAVIGKPIKNASEEAAGDAIFGYTILTDVTARDFQFERGQLTLAKNFDGFCPMGPCVVTADELPNADKLVIRSYRNDVVVQEGAMSDQIISMKRLVSRLSEVMMLEPGDVVTSGTPPGAGFNRMPQQFLAPGDRIAAEIEGIGRLENTIS